MTRNNGIVVGLLVIIVFVGALLFSTRYLTANNVNNALRTTIPTENNNYGAEGTAFPSAVPTSTSATSVIPGSKHFLDITTPTNNSTVSTSTLKVTGKTTPNSDVFVNDKETKADASGNFLVNLPLEEGENEISVSANDSLGSYIEKTLLVTYQL